MPVVPASRAAPAAAAPARKQPRRKPARPPSKGMQGMHHGSMAMPATSASLAAAAPASGSMQGMDHAAAKGPAGGGMAGMSLGSMQGGDAPANARSPDYSDGVGYGSMQGMDMADNKPLGMLLIDQLETFHGRDGSGQRWEAEAWYGNDSNKLWVRTEGDRTPSRIEEGTLEALWNHSIAPYWSTQLGVRQDLGTGPRRSWAAFGVQGLAPYWFELEATAYVGQAGRTAARLRGTYELLFTQRLILQPELEVNLHGQADPARRIGRGLADAQMGLRLRYEIRRQFAPYIGVVWTRRFGATADFARIDCQPIFDRQLVAGVRIWL
ncbi:MAG: copper resistance protein B [Rhodanobacter sp.]|nr:MAG: copper resistance protein B [Rhodanobacter sp.]